MRSLSYVQNRLNEHCCQLTLTGCKRLSDVRRACPQPEQVCPWTGMKRRLSVRKSIITEVLLNEISRFLFQGTHKNILDYTVRQFDA